MKLTNLVAYFKTDISENHIDLHHFVYGPIDSLLKLISDSRSLIKYPCLMLETPNYRVKGGTNQILKPDFAFVVLDKSKQDDYDHQAETLDKTLEIILDIWQKLKDDSKARQIGFRVNLEKDYPIDPVQPQGPDYTIGWRMEIDMQYPLPNCPRPEKWQNP